MLETRDFLIALCAMMTATGVLLCYFPPDPLQTELMAEDLLKFVLKVQAFLNGWNKKISIYDLKIFTRDELKQYDGRKGSKGLYISILGEVFDVHKGKRHYGPGGAYHIFAGKDASRSLISGDFTGPVTDHVLDLSLKELLSLKDWLNFFKSEYICIGKLSGRYYDDNGKKTQYSKDLDEKFVEAEKYMIFKQMDDKHFPPCNVEWTAENGSRVWCSKKSGGIERTWVGVPRKLYKVGSHKFRCACVDLTKLEDPDSVQYARRGHIQEYKECDPKKTSCFLKNT